MEPQRNQNTRIARSLAEAPAHPARRTALSLAVLGFVASLAAVDHAHAAASADELDQRVKILERQLEIQKEEADTKAKDATTTKIDDKGVSIKKGDFELKIKSLVQADLRYYLDDFNPANATIRSNTNRNGLYSNDGVVFRRIRPTFEGTLGKLVGFRLTPEFAGNGAGEVAGSNAIVDAYIDLKFDPAYTLRAGKVKGPVALERLQSGGALSFVERGFPTELAPNRDLGVQLQGELFNATVNYTLGYYNGTADGRDITGTDVDNRKEVGARLFFEPFKNDPGLLQGLGFGIGSSFGPKDQGEQNAGNVNGFLPRYRSPGQLQIFNYRGAAAATAATASAAGSNGTTGVYADGDHVRLSPQLYYYRNSFGLLAEYISSEQDLSQGLIPAAAIGTTSAVTLSTPTATLSRKLENTAWQVATTYVLTGEDASFRGVVKPNEPFTVGGPGWGAIELALRYGELDIDNDAFDVVTASNGLRQSFADPVAVVSKAEAYTVGVNWYLTSNVKAVVNFSEVQYDGGRAGTAAAPKDREDEKTVFARLQLAF